MDGRSAAVRLQCGEGRLSPLLALVVRLSRRLESPFAFPVCPADERVKEIEILVGRYELEVLGRNQSRLSLGEVDRAWLAALSRLLAKERWSALFVGPGTLLRWQRRLWLGTGRTPAAAPDGVLSERVS